MRNDGVVAAFAIILLGLASASAVLEGASSSTTASVAYASTAGSQVEAKVEHEKSDRPVNNAPLTRQQILKEGPVALQQNCTKCHGTDKWEGTNRDRDGWAAIVKEMSQQMTLAKMPPMSDRTTNVIIDYLALTQPQ
jgi:hypothetical protein